MLSVDNFYQIVSIERREAFLQIYFEERFKNSNIHSFNEVNPNFIYYKNYFYVIYYVEKNMIKLWPWHNYTIIKNFCVGDYLLIIPLCWDIESIEEQLWTLLSNLDNSNPKLIESITKIL